MYGKRPKISITLFYKLKKGFRMSKYDIPPQFECQNKISNVN